MAERHTVDFDREAFNLLTDHERRLITMQFERGDCLCYAATMRRLPVLPKTLWPAPLPTHSVDCPSLRPLKFAGRILRPVRRRFGDGPAHRLVRWLLRLGPSPLIPARRLRPHPDNTDVVCWDLAVREGCRPEEALAALLDTFRGIPGYRRTLGSPLDPDGEFDETSAEASADASSAAMEVLRRYFEARRQDEDTVIEESASNGLAPAEPDDPPADATSPDAFTAPD